MSSRIRVTVVGYLSLDQIICPAGTFEDVPGGAAYYCAAAAAVAGASVRLAVRTAADYPAEALLALESLGVDLSLVEAAEGLSRRSKLHDPSGRDRTMAHVGDASWWEAIERLAPPIPDGGGIFAYTAMPPHILQRQIEARTAADRLIVDTSPPYATVAGRELLSLVPRTHCFAPSREETRLMLPDLDDDEAVAFLARQTAVMVQKRGPDGLVLQRDGEDRLHQASTATTILDTTGAGDSVVGALAASMADGCDDRTMLRRCADAAALTVSGVGISALLRRGIQRDGGG